MLDVGWSELLVIAVVLIVVVGPKDLPPMLRAFGRMSRKFTSMAGEFRKQFDDALNEADMGDLRQTISDVQRLNPVNSLREAMNPLRQAADDIRSDIRKSVETAVPTGVTLPDPAVKLEGQPVVPAADAKTLASDQPAVVTSTAALAEALPVAPVEEVIQVKPKSRRKPKVETAGVAVAEAIAAKPSRRKVTTAIPAASADTAVTVETVAAKPRRKTTPKKDKA